MKLIGLTKSEQLKRTSRLDVIGLVTASVGVAVLYIASIMRDTTQHWCEGRDEENQKRVDKIYDHVMDSSEEA